jgi:hypothetical protein
MRIISDNNSRARLKIKGFIPKKFKNFVKKLKNKKPEFSKIELLGNRLRGMSLIRESKSFTLQCNGYFADVHLTNSKKIVVTFESGGFVKDGASHREAWGGGYFRHKDISYIGIKPTSNNWYVSPPLEDFLNSLKFILEQYEDVLTYGSSMGAFAALTYADHLGATKVIALCPQSSRHPVICPWERPLSKDVARLDVNNKFTDAVGNYANAKSVYIFADFYFQRDRLHAQRLAGPNVIMINTPFIEHGTPMYLNPLGLLMDIPMAVLDDTFDANEFYKKFRRRRELKKYYRTLEAKAAKRPHIMEIINRHKKNGKLGP